MNMARPSFKVTQNQPGSDLTGETAAALGKILFDPPHEKKLLLSRDNVIYLNTFSYKV